MNISRWTWLVSGLLYLAFFAWYTPLGGPLSEAETHAYIQKFRAASPAPSEESVGRLRRFMQEDTGGHFVMVNLIHLYDRPLPAEGVKEGESSQEVLNKYMAYMYPALFLRASHPVLYGDLAADAMELKDAEGMERWTFSAAMRYRSRRDIVDIITNPAFSGAHAFKIAAMQKTIAVPLDPWFHPGDPRLLLALFLTCFASLVSQFTGHKEN